ncbi:hypothetical protein HNQ40_000114 [Algisphaera agarilytica]|uniref:Uncharacterized protein n=1 Tax=Algisphaera agarilytica TaxID=1385975 RepID=A0A7X0H3B5_9BACT|nr:hypothetical protein [Algisphaera agarilytica]
MGRNGRYPSDTQNVSRHSFLNTGFQNKDMNFYDTPIAPDMSQSFMFMAQ